MKRIIFWAAVFAAQLCASAFAADMPMKAPAYGPAPQFNWTGFYVGATFGYEWGDWNYFVPFNGFQSASNNVHGVLGGPTVGYNFQNGNWVLGIESDYSWADTKSDDNSGCSPTCVMHWPWVATVRGRLGYAADRWLVYGTAGGAFSHMEENQTLLNGSKLVDAKKDIEGWAFGGGVEYAFSPNWSAKLEYLRLDFGHQNALDLLVPADGDFRHDMENMNLIRVGLNYRFASH